MLNGVYAPWPSFSKEEADKVSEILLSNKVNYWTGSEGKAFEKEFAAWAGTEYAIAVANGTVAIDLALQGLGIGRAYGGSDDDEVIVTPRTFLASVSAVVNAGAKPVFADVELDNGNLSAATIEKHISSKTKAAIVVHLAGIPADMDPIMELANQHRFFVIEDCAQAHGASYKGRPVGSIGHVGAWSFCQDKIMTTGGEGGAVTTNNPSLWNRMWSFKDHGKSWSAVFEQQHPPGFRWLHESFGTNWRMTEIQSAIGRHQLGLIKTWQKKREENAKRIISAFEIFALNGAIRIPKCYFLTEDDQKNAWYKLYLYVDEQKLKTGWSRDRIAEEISQRNAICMQGSCSEVYLEKAFEKENLQPSERLKNAEQLGRTSLMFLVHPTMTKDDIDRTIDAIKTVMTSATE